MFPTFTGQHDVEIVAEGRRCRDWTATAASFAPLNPTSAKRETGECSWNFQPSGEKVQCGTCSKLYASKKSLKIHNRIHTGYKPYACPICPKRFTQTNVLKAHINYHTGRRDWLCKICGKAFTQSAHLRTHEKTHSQRKDYQCPFCQQNFSCKGVRDRHIRQHTGEKPYKCVLCEKRFTRGESLKFHENAHQGIRPYSCPHEHCRKTFTKQSSLKRHIRSTHTGISGHKNRPSKFACHLGHYTGYSAVFPTNMSSPTATSDCMSVVGSSNGPDSPLTIKIEELDEDDTEDQVLQNFIGNLSVAELDRFNQYLGVNSIDIALESVLDPPFDHPSNTAKTGETKQMVFSNSQPKDVASFTGQFGMNMWDPADWDVLEEKLFERPFLPNLLDLPNMLNDAQSHFQQIACNAANSQPFSSLYSTSF